MPVSSMLFLVETDEGIEVLVMWKGLSYGEDTLEPIQKVNEDVPKLFVKFLELRSTSQGLSRKARDLPGL